MILRQKKNNLKCLWDIGRVRKKDSKMRKTKFLTLIAIFVALFTGCEDPIDQTESTTDQTEPPTERIKILSGHTGWVRSVAYSPDGTKIVSGAGDTTVKIWDANTGQCLKTLTGHTEQVRSVAYSPDGTKIVSSSDEAIDAYFLEIIKIWDANTGELIKTLSGYYGIYLSLAYSPDGTKIIGCAHDNNIKIWDVE